MAARDRVTFIGMMLVRLGFVIAFLIGLLLLLGWIEQGFVVMLHMASGLLSLAGIWVAAARTAMRSRPGAGALAGAAALVLAGALMGLDVLGPGPGLLHMAIMIAAVGMAEMGAARAARG